MKVNIKDLTTDQRKEVQSTLKGNGLTGKQVNVYVDGKSLAIEVKCTGQIIVL